jgi:hypothetical protein
MINLEKIIRDVLNEDNVSGAALGAPAAGTSQFSGDFYAPGDTRIPYSVYGGVMTRRGLIKKRKKRKRKRKRKKK